MNSYSYDVGNMRKAARRKERRRLRQVYMENGVPGLGTGMCAEEVVKWEAGRCLKTDMSAKETAH